MQSLLEVGICFDRTLQYNDCSDRGCKVGVVLYVGKKTVLKFRFIFNFNYSECFNLIIATPF